MPKPVQVARLMRSAGRLPRASPRACSAAHIRWSGVVAGDEVVAPGLYGLWCRGGGQRASQPQYDAAGGVAGERVPGLLDRSLSLHSLAIEQTQRGRVRALACTKLNYIFNFKIDMSNENLPRLLFQVNRKQNRQRGRYNLSPT